MTQKKHTCNKYLAFKTNYGVSRQKIAELIHMNCSAILVVYMCGTSKENSLRFFNRPFSLKRRELSRMETLLTIQFL